MAASKCIQLTTVAQVKESGYWCTVTPNGQYFLTSNDGGHNKDDYFTAEDLKNQDSDSNTAYWDFRYIETYPLILDETTYLLGVSDYAGQNRRISLLDLNTQDPNSLGFVDGFKLKEDGINNFQSGLTA